MAELIIMLAVVGSLALQGAAIFVLAYWAARLAIRHEHRLSQGVTSDRSAEVS
jgi:hypothetical protein